MKSLLMTTALILGLASPALADSHAEEDVCDGIADGEMTEDGIMCPQDGNDDGERDDDDSDDGDDESDAGDDDDDGEED